MNFDVFMKHITMLIKPKFYISGREQPNPSTVLDIGIANNSYQECKLVFPNAMYTGVDKVDHNMALLSGDRFVLCDLEREKLVSKLDNKKFDLIIANHVLEHLTNGETVFRSLCSLLTAAGIVYCEFPSIRTAASAKTRFNYHFHDDPTHKRFYQLEVLANISIEEGCKVISCGAASTPLKDALSIPRATMDLLRCRESGSALLFVQRKIDYILCKKMFSVL